MQRFSMGYDTFWQWNVSCDWIIIYIQYPLGPVSHIYIHIYIYTYIYIYSYTLNHPLSFHCRPKTWVELIPLPCRNSSSLLLMRLYIYKQAWLVVSGRASHVSASVQELSPKQQQMRWQKAGRGVTPTLRARAGLNNLRDLTISTLQGGAP